MRIPVERRAMQRDVSGMTVAELRREAAAMRAWIRDVTGPKRARLCAIMAEIERRGKGKGGKVGGVQ